MANESEISQQLIDAIFLVLDSYGQAGIKAIKDKLLASDKLASGSLYDSIDYDLYSDNESIISLNFRANNYYKWVDGGRRPGQPQPPMQDILKWIQSRRINPLDVARRNKLGRFSRGFKFSQKRDKAGRFASGKLIDQQTRLAWAIAKSIAKNGFKGINLSGTISDDKLKADITRVLNEQLNETITEQFLESILTIKSPKIKVQKLQ